MHITIDLRMLRSSGIGVYLQNVIPRILRTRKSDEFCLLVRQGEELTDMRLAKSKIQKIEFRSFIYSLGQQWELWRKIPGHTNLFWAPHYDIPVFHRGKLLVTVHDVFHLAMPFLAGGFHRRLYARFMFKRMVRQAAAICAISEFTKYELMRLTGAREDKIQVIPLGVDASWLRLTKKKNPHPRRFLLFVGNIKPHKNLKRLLEAFDRIRHRIPHDLILVGQKEGFLTGDREVQAMAGRFGGRVSFTGYVPEHVLKQYFLHAECLVFPSIYEGFGLPVVEAMACGCPVVASKAASIPEIGADAVCYFDPYHPEDMADKILQVVQKPGLRNELRRKGFRRFRDFSWEKTAVKTSHLMDSLLA
jgi:glycosyltransferase involved in cell wall biosynthesis